MYINRINGISFIIYLSFIIEQTLQNETAMDDQPITGMPYYRALVCRYILNYNYLVL